MTCLHCNRANLPGGLRCAYCGAYLPGGLEFDLGPPTGPPPRPPEVVTTAPATPLPGNAAKAVGVITPIALLLLKLKSFATLFLQFGKIATTLFSMVAYAGIYAQIYGWKFAVGMTVSIFLHEMGHVFVNWRYGLKQTAPVFIPFLGAAIFLKQFPDNPKIQAESGAGGPIAGFLTALGCYGIYGATHDPYWLALAHFGLWINLFNLVPLPFLSLDGSHIHTVFSPGLWNMVLGVMLLWAIKIPSPLLWLILIVSFVVRLSYQDNGRYLLAAPAVRARMAVIFLLMCLPMSWLSDITDAAMKKDRLEQGATTAAPSSGSATPVRSSESSGQTTKEAADEARLRARLEEILRKGAKERRARREAALQRRLMESPLLWGGVFLLCAVAIGLWCATISLLAKVKDRLWDGADGRFLAGMLLLLPVTAGAAFALPLDFWARLQIVGGYLAGTAVAFGFAVYTAVRGLRGNVNPPTALALRVRALVAFATGVFVVAYAGSNLVLAGMLVLGTVLFYGLHRWLFFASVGSLRLQMDDRERAVAALSRAAERCTDPEEKAFLWDRVGANAIRLERGATALEAFERHDQICADGERRSTGLAQIADWDRRATAYGLTDRFDAALTCCEQMLRAAGQDRQQATLIPIAEAYVHLALARFALWRGWYDEATAQADWCLKRLSPKSVAARALLETIKAEALTEQARRATADDERAVLLQKATAACDSAAKQSHDASAQAYTATVRARIAELNGDTTAARAAVKRALELQPGHLACRYWFGRIADPGTLNRLAAEFPDDHWGRLAGSSPGA